VLMLAGINDQKLDSTASYPSSSSHSPCLAVSSVIPGPLRRWSGSTYGFSAHVSFTSTLVIRWSADGFGFGYGYGRKWAISFGRGFGYGHNCTSVTALLSATAETRKTGFGRFLVFGVGESNGFGPT